ncbi:LacI family DNA-binding transcriptional regulator [Vibrio sp. SCSIO 43136]|uniref:substrate-binding domain-containing protein n=1 Tax=Vibrio sp. SCSIO 43136 TaxID=2819101 RepID=UPI002074E6A1|nr:LacI family DNA-binding transcriptional regulator [Vibrio sp. SCSIO 43136]USD68082.1 LacI family DNA-binding transcriptional regulator [Vibrio sp. SCSIO 43136]
MVNRKVEGKRENGKGERDKANGKKLKLADIAQLAGVSKSTVSFVLNGHAQKHRIAPDTVEKVRRVVEEYQYAPSLYARALKSKRTLTYGLVIPDLTNMGFATIAHHLEKLCLQQGYQLLIASTEDDIDTEKNAVNNLISRQVDGLMVASCHLDAHFYSTITQDTPTVFFDRQFAYDAATFVVTDTKQSVEQLVTKLVQGRQECVYFGGQTELSPSKARLAGFQSALKNQGMSLETNRVSHGNYHPDSGYQQMKACVEELGRLPEAIFTGSYSLLEGVMKYFVQHPELDKQQVKVATFDNYSILDCLEWKIDSVEQNCESIALKVFNALSDEIDNLAEPKLITVDAKIHYRSK